MKTGEERLNKKDVCLHIEKKQEEMQKWFEEVEGNGKKIKWVTFDYKFKTKDGLVAHRVWWELQELKRDIKERRSDG